MNQGIPLEQAKVYRGNSQFFPLRIRGLGGRSLAQGLVFQSIGNPHRSPKSRLSRTYRRNLRETAAASYRGSTGLRQTLGQGLHTPSTGPSVGPTVGVPQAYGRP